jgi:Sugar kinases, ribokinase family
MKFACVGDNCIDIYQNTNSMYCGGNPVNVGVYVVRSGDQASYIGAVGTDQFGQFMLDSLQGKGVDISHVKVIAGDTAKTWIKLVEGERVFQGYDEGVLADFDLTNEDIDFIAGHDIVVTGRWGKIQGQLGLIKARGIPIAFDFATKLGDDIFKQAVKFVDYAFFSAEEDTKEVRDSLRDLYQNGVRVAICTLGEHGSLAYDGNDFTNFAIIPCDVKDTMGAGDSYIAGFLRGILRRLPISECMRMGAECSSVTLGYFGAWQ